MAEKVPFSYVWFDFFTLNNKHLFKKKLDVLYPNFQETLHVGLMKNPSSFFLFSIKVSCHVYISVFFDLLKHHDL